MFQNISVKEGGIFVFKDIFTVTTRHIHAADFSPVYSIA